MEEQTMTKRERRERNKKDRLQEMDSQKKEARNKNILTGAGVALLLIAVGFGLFRLASGSSYELVVLDPTIGPDGAPVVIEEYSDFECPACARAFPVVKQLLEEYPTQVQLVYKDMTLPQHADAKPAAAGALCAAQQGKFKPFHDAIFESQPQWAGGGQSTTLEDVMQETAANLELDIQEWDTCRRSSTARREVTSDFTEGSNAGVTSTPTFLVNGVKVEGSQSLFAWIQRINEELEKKGLTPENAAPVSDVEVEAEPTE